MTLTGTAFVNGATVLFGATAATSVTFNSATSVTAVAPPHAAGTVAVTVTNPDARSAALSGAYQYFDHSGLFIFKDGFESGDAAIWGAITP